MRVDVVGRPEPVVSLDEAKRWLRVDHAYDDALIADLIDAATARIDGPGGTLGRAIGQQTLELRVSCWPRRRALWLPYPPVQTVSEVRYLGAAGPHAIVDPSLYSLCHSELGPILSFSPALEFPALARQADALRVTYVAGHPPAEVPIQLRQAILRMIARSHAHRGEPIAGSLTEDPEVSDLLASFQVWSFP